jgi:hypothetical protein
MRLSALFLGIGAAGSFGTAQAKPREVAVCVEVRVQRAPDKPASARPVSVSAAPSEKAAAPVATDNAAAAEAAAATTANSSAAAVSSAPPADSARSSELGPRAEAVTTLDSAATVDIDPDGSRDPRVQSGAHLPLGQTPEAYLARLLEHFVTHERGYVAVKQGCEQRIVVDLYPLRLGWTVFASYSGTGREERVDQLLPTELSQFAERSVLALLRDVSINDTVDRNNVLWADSLKSTQSIRGRGHVILGLGTRLRGGMFRSVDEAGVEVKPSLRLFTPMLMTVGYRGQFEEFGVEAAAELDLGTSQVAARRNPGGGHVDFGGSTGITLHAVRYANVRGLTSLYFGGGATFALHWFSLIKPESERTGDSRSTLWSGGLDVDGVVGYEFMRASALSFYLQSEINLPAYAVRNENEAGSVNTWFPGAALKLGAIF